MAAPPGKASEPPLPGVTPAEGGAHVAVVSRHAERIEVCLFDAAGEIETARLPLTQRQGDLHHGFIEGLAPGVRYGFRAHGPWAPEAGHRFDAAKLLADPNALAIDRPYRYDPALAVRGTDTAMLVPKCVVAGPMADAAPLPAARPQFIYEVPVRAFTRLHPDIPPEKRGTVAAIAEPVIIDHLKRLGVDTVELMPVAPWIDERHLAPSGLSNAWGYNPVSFMAADPRLAPGGLDDIRTTVAALHREGIRVILDVVFNHTGESDVLGPTLSLRGLDNALYFAHADGQLINDTGCGNTLALYRAPAVRLVMDAMRSWVTRTGVDGFRFDLAPVLGRLPGGFDREAPLLAAIEQDPLLRERIMIAEPWDIGPGGYQLGAFPARWHEWNDRYRDTVRRFWRGDGGAAGELATRMSGSSDLFAPHRPPSSSINFVAAHDGFTLRDTVTYTLKNNHANGEGNRDGSDHEPTWPGGDVRALLATLFLSRGIPMLTAGDEFGRTQRGNNNAYAQDNETTWLDWNAADRSLLAFTADLAALRRSFPRLTEDRFLTGAPAAGIREPDALWLGENGEPMNWHDPDAAVLGLVLSSADGRMAIVFNRSLRHIAVPLPERDGCRWNRIFSSRDDAESGVPPHAVCVFQESRIRNAGATDQDVASLARLAGIESEWWEVDGTHHRVAPETLRALLDALRVPRRTAGDVDAAARMLDSRTKAGIARAGPAVEVWPEGRQRQRIHIAGEGIDLAVEARPGQAAVAELPPGIFSVFADSSPDDRRTLIVSPGPCWLPHGLMAGKRVFGLASHLYALRHAGDGGIGDFETLRRFADVTARAGGDYAGLNPLHHLFPSDRSRASPYQPSDRRYIDPIYINIPALLDAVPSAAARKAASRSRAAFARLESLGEVDYQAVWAAKREVLEAAFSGFAGSPAFDDAVRRGGAALERHGRFEAERMGEAPSPQRIAFRAFLQWIADTQLGAAAKSRSLYRDLALGCAFDGGEIAEDRTLFADGVSIGAPPDPFSRNGQVWNLPPFSPLELDARGFAPMQAILSANMRHAAALRIDHILGFARQFWVPAGAEGRNGAYIRFPMEALIAVTAIESWRHQCLVVGEDLGTIPDGLRESLAAANIFSYRVLWFERDGPVFRPPESYPRHALACLASHDLPTFAGWRRARDVAIDRDLGRISGTEAEMHIVERRHEVDALDRLAGAATPDESEANIALHGFVARTPSQIMLIQADDLAGEVNPLNVPGTDTEYPNWRRRLSIPVDELLTRPMAAGIIDRVKRERPS